MMPDTADARQMLDAAVSEADFMWQIMQLARLQGFLAYHPFDSRRSAVGYPDLTLVHPWRRVILWVEVKRHDGIVTPAQERWRDAIRAAGGDWRVWRPQDWSEIEATLKGAT
jgi:VRR-NUC domain